MQKLKYLIPFIPVIGILIIIISMFSDKLEHLIYVKYELFGTSVEKFILHNKFVFIPSAIIQAASFIFLSYLINLI